MHYRLALAAFAAALALAPAARAADCDAGTPDAKAIPFAVTDDASAQAFAASIRSGFAGTAYLATKGLKLAQPDCVAANVSIGTQQYVLRASDDSAYPRSLRGTMRSAWLFAALRPETAARFAKVLGVSMGAGGLTFLHVKRDDLIYLLAAGAPGDAWSVFGFYDKIPATARLAQVMCAAALGSLPVAAVFHDKDKSVELKDLSALASLDDVGRSGGPCTVGSPP